jgi:hypothetical protein
VKRAASGVRVDEVQQRVRGERFFQHLADAERAGVREHRR